MNDTLLRTSLLDLLNLLGSDTKGIFLGGGYGLYLKQLHLAESGIRTLISSIVRPAPRATQDIDLMLSAEWVADARSMGAVRAALDKLDYKVIKGSEYLQFSKMIGDTQEVKLDLLTVQYEALKDNPAIIADKEKRRARPKAENRPKLHAHPTDGALTLTDSPLVIEVAGTLTNGQNIIMPVAIPHPFNYLLMKLTAYRDRRNDSNKDLGRHHALDIFRIIAMLTRPEYDYVQENLKKYADDSQVHSCVDILRSDFESSSSSGILAMREHPIWRNDQQLSDFLKTLNGLTT